MTATIAELLGGVPTELHIGGKDVPSADGARFDVVDPANGEVIASVADGSVVDALAAVDAAAVAAADWAATAPRHRAEVLRVAFEAMTDEADDYAHLISLENGKALADARGEVAYAAEFFRWYGEEAVRLAGSLAVAPSGTNRIMVMHQPVGVCVLVTPWNFPAAMATRKIGPALAAGCTVVLKPASDTPLTALAMARTLESAGVPPGVVNVLPARRSGAVVSAMLHDPRVRKLSFTGSTEVGRVLLREAADRVLNTSMELGGNAPFLVLADADLDEAVEGAMVAKMRNGGEACTAANRFYVHASIADDFGRRLADRMAGLTLGPGTDPQTRIGPLINADAVDKVDSLVRDAIDRGAHCLTGARRPERPGCYYEPTVLAGVPEDSVILREEIFGPVAPIVTFDDEDVAIELANATEFGLVAYVYTRDLARGLRVSERLESGMVGLNRGVVSDPAAPFGGVKQSGIGREGGHEGVLDYTESKYVAVQW
ncbi:MAG: succinate-semialdehyde dehydrogenase / glutarate-semialdehyde dehydrogenase [Pseudonocardiales bacterium]|jgi:succinate-semialdehyde dehydrogenase/glutarate-semialdehyde dehydrogenase|nr:succinate semialdehyde dehydrogenase [Jatrophihabitans sp.]MDT4903439.1 succinate-semialdehyde dehydrogenase / glutarate-semialdehyde dehydrogenase [Pseudonocardiales bacterium]